MNAREDFFAGYQYGRDTGHREAAMVALIVLAALAMALLTYWTLNP